MMRGPYWAGILLALFISPAWAIGPPLDTARQSLVSARASNGHEFRIDVTHIDNTNAFSGHGRFAGGQRLALESSQSPDIGPQAAVPWNLVYAALSAPDPFEAMGIDAATESRIVLLPNRSFAHRFGEQKAIVLSENLTRLEELHLHSEGVHWKLHLHWHREERTMQRLVLLKNGSPTWRIELQPNGTPKPPNSQKQREP